MKKKNAAIMLAAVMLALAMALLGAGTVMAAEAGYETKGNKVYFTAGDNEMRNRQMLDEYLQEKYGV